MPYGNGMGKKKPMKKKKKVTAMNTRKATDYHKKAEKIHAAKGTSLAPAGSKMRMSQDMAAKERAMAGKSGSKLTSSNRESRVSMMGQSMARKAAMDEMNNSTFRNADQMRMKARNSFNNNNMMMKKKKGM